MWRRMHCKGRLAITLIAGACASSALANKVISDFDTGTYYGGVQGWFPYGSIGLGIEAAPVGNGGNTSNWMWQAPNQYYGSMTNQNWATPGILGSDFDAHTQLELDLIVPGTGPHAWLPSNPATSMQVEFQVTGGGAGTVTKTKTVTFDASLKDQVQHVVVDYSSLLPLDPTATGFNLSIRAEPGYDWGWDSGNTSGIPYSPYLYYDNIQLTNVPEPASLGLLSLGGLALIRRRRA